MITDERKKQMKEILDRIELIWERFPELRLGQLVINAITEDALYYSSDEKLLKLLDEKYNEFLK